MSRAFVGQPAPFFKANALHPNESISEVSLDEYKGKYLVLFFYPLDFTFVCPTEIVAFSEAAAKFKAIGAEVLACSVDSEFSHLAWVKTPRKQGGLGKMNIPILADLTKQIARDYGVLLEKDGIALRGLFIIDPEGTLQQITINNLPVGRNVDEALRLIQAFQFHAQHGEVCPANWNPGAKTMKPDPVGSQSYFAGVQE